MSNTPKRRWTDKWFVPPVLLSFVTVTVIFLIVLVAFSFLVHKAIRNSHRIDGLVTQNTMRIEDIQKSRIESCKRTYEGIKEVFSPFYPPKPRTPKQLDDVEKFEKTIHHLISNCVKQTRTKHPVTKPSGDN